MRFAKAVVKHRILILILTVALLVPSAFGMAATRVNYDMLTYLPEDMDTVVGQNELLEDFNKGAFTFLIFEDMPNKDVAALKQQVEQVDHVDTVLCTTLWLISPSPWRCCRTRSTRPLTQTTPP